ncbi:MAG: nuclear transport factor 2 family protein [Candidatus Rokubacteria bacterium]|nr:nuclear transport factor 2 family protein [Candidatus Rokubacteria bacterium]
MPVIEHADAPLQPFPGGATYRTLVGDDEGSTPVRIGIQTSPPGYATPEHSHPYVEILTILDGTGEAWMDGAEGVIPLRAGMTLVLPADVAHGFRVTGHAPLVTYGVHSSPHRIVEVRRRPVVTEAMLEAFGAGWNRPDVDFLMTFMSDDPVFEVTAGPEACGRRYTGRERVRHAFARVFEIFPDAHFGDARHFVSGDRGVSEWFFTGTRADSGAKLEVTGCDVFTFRDGKIAVKNSYFKNRI